MFKNNKMYKNICPVILYSQLVPTLYRKKSFYVRSFNFKKTRRLPFR